MLTCPNGHSNPKGQQLCQECDALLVADERSAPPWYRRWGILAASAVLAVVGISAMVFALFVWHAGSEAAKAPPAKSDAIELWWNATRRHVADLQGALDDARRNVDRVDKNGLERACQRIHDYAEVDLQAHLPSPDPDLTAELNAAIEDAHTTSHMCLSAMAGSPNNYDMEFLTYLEQADKHLEAAKDIVDKSRLEA